MLKKDSATPNSNSLTKNIKTSSNNKSMIDHHNQSNLNDPLQSNILSFKYYKK